MNVAAIKYLVETHSIDALILAEEKLINEEVSDFDIPGNDEGEKLTHILAAIFCKTEMQQTSITFQQALRLYSQRVRNSLG